MALQAATKAASEDLSGWAGGSGVSDVESRIFFLAFAQTQCGAGRRLNRSSALCTNFGVKKCFTEMAIIIHV